MSKVRPRLVILLPILILVLLRVPSLFESYWYGDEGIYAAVATELSRGKELYSQTWDHKPPLIFWLYYPAAVLGWSLGFVLLRAVNIIFGALTLIAADKILQKVKIDTLPRLASLIFLSILLGSTILEGNVLNAEVIFITFNTFFLLLLLRVKYFYLAGFLAFLSLGTKVPGFVEVALVSLAFGVIWMREKGLGFVFLSYTKIAAGFLVPAISATSYFLLRGTISDFYYANFGFNRIYSLQEASFIRISGSSVPSNYFQALSVVLVLLATSALFWKKKLSSFTFLALNLFTAQLFASLLSAKNYGHYFLQVLPGATFILAITLQTAKKRLNLKNAVPVVIFIILLSPLLYTLKKGGNVAVYAKPGEYYPLFLKGYLLRDAKARSEFWWGQGGDADKITKFSNYLENTVQKQNSVYIYTSRPWIIALADINYTNKHEVWFHLQYRKEHLEEDLKNLRDADIVVIDNDVRLLPGIRQEIETGYEKIDSFENFDILRKTQSP